MRCKAVLFDIKNETLPREDLAKLQLKRLQDVCRRVYANVPFYKKRFDEMGVKPEDIRSLDDLRRLPFTVKQDLRNNYPYGLFALPRANLARIQASSGTTGQAIVMGYTQRDLDNWAELVARCMCASGVTPTDIVHVAYGYGLFTGGLGAHDGAQKLGAMVVPASGGATRRQGQLLRDLGATVLACTPSFALHLWESAMEIGIDFRELPLKIGIFGGEPWSETMRHTMEEKMGIDAHNIYGLTEIMGPGVAIDCMEHNGIHLWEDHFIAEIIDPETGVGIISDVCIKRKIRNYVDLVKGCSIDDPDVEEGELGYKIYVQEGAVLNERNERAYKHYGLKPVDKKLPKKVEDQRKVTQFMCDNFFDIRTFGAVMTTGRNCGQVRGPVQLCFAESVDPVSPLEMSITRMAATEESSWSSTIF